MPDRIQREIEEILAKLDDGSETPAPVVPGDRKPISITTARERRAPKQKAPRAPRNLPVGLEPTTLLFAGAGIMVIGLVLANVVADSLIWLSFAGVVIFLGAFAWSFMRNPKSTPVGQAPPGKVYWRDRYIEYTPSNPGFGAKLRRKIRGK